ncbi:hypothetical protein OROGR_028790 [Orobanche gracilis]
MATESPVRIMDSSGAERLAPPSSAFATSATTRAVSEELVFLLRGGRIDRDQSSIAPNRSGSAPPSMEGSFAAFGNNWRLDSHGSGSVYALRDSLSTHEEEEPEDGGSPKGRASGDSGKSSSILFMPGLSFNGRHKSLVDLIQADFPRTPSPVFSQNCSSSQDEEPFHHDMQSLSLDSQSVKASKHPESGSSLDSGIETDVTLESTTAKDPSDIPRTSVSPHKDNLTSKDAYSGDDFVSGDPISSVASKSLHKVVDNHVKQNIEFAEQNEVQIQHTYSQQAVGYHVPISQVRGNNNSIVLHGQNAKNSPVEMQQPLVPAPGPLPPVYGSAAAYMAPGNSIYANFSSSGLYPQYSGYAMGSSFIPPQYPPRTGFPLNFNGSSGQSLSGIPTGESISKGSAMHDFNRFYGQHGLTMHSTFPASDPLSLQFFQQTVQDPYSVPLQYSHLPMPGMINHQVHSFTLRNDPATPAAAAAYSGDQKYQLPSSSSVSFSSARNVGIPSTNSYLSSPTGLGFLPQFPLSPLGSPVLPESPVGGASFRRRFDFGFSQSSARNAGSYSRWRGQMGTDGINEHRKHPLLEELKASSARRIDLSDVIGCIVEFSTDQHGSRFIQQKLENSSVEEKESIFKEVLPHCSKLITDVFGNYVIQKFFEHGTYEQRRNLASQLSGQMPTLSLQMYGCRVIQKALEFVEVEPKTELIRELDGHVMRCVRDQNGNHVIQKCIECVSAEKIDFIICAFKGQVASLSTHPYGCRVIQEFCNPCRAPSFRKDSLSFIRYGMLRERILEHCSNDLRCQSVVDEILESAYDLAHDQYGNYVTQHILEMGKPLERSRIISKLCGKIVQMSQHKYASNVVEKCLELGDAAERQLLIQEILLQSKEDNDSLLAMMKDQFANYVVQKILEISNGKQRKTLLDRIQLHLVALKKYTYGKHIVARFEHLCGEGQQQMVMEFPEPRGVLGAPLPPGNILPSEMEVVAAA